MGANLPHARKGSVEKWLPPQIHRLVTASHRAALLVYPYPYFEVFPGQRTLQEAERSFECALFHRIRRQNDLKLLFSRLFTPFLAGRLGFRAALRVIVDCRVRSTAADLHGKEVPSVLSRTHGRSSIPGFCKTSRLTKLNYNACIFADGEPGDLEFADRVGEILTAGPIGTDTPAAAVQVLYLRIE